MFLRILLLLLVAFNKLSSSENCETIDWLQPFNNSSNFHCSFNGWYPDLTDENCSRYFVCVRNSENFLQLYLTCPNGTYFNEYTISCTDDYICPYKLTTTTEKAVSNSCLYESDSNYFECNKNGSFPNNNDLTCTSYFYCINIISPILTLKTKYFCSNNTYFNPETEVCEAEYKCPCGSYSTSLSSENTYTTVLSTSAITEHSRLTTETETTQITNSGETKITTKEVTSKDGETTTEERTTDEDISTKVDDTTESVITTSNSTELTQTTTIDECSYNSNPNYFTCTVKGRFRNANDRTCQTYFLCSILSSGRVIQTKYSCPTNSNFNPKLQLCDVDYECPCQTSEVTSTTEEVTTQDVTVTTTQSINTEETKVTTEESTSTNGETTTQERTTEEDESTKGSDTTESVTTSTSTTITQTTTNDECFYNSNPNYFTCTVKGRFSNANDRTCQTYFLCSILSSGRVIQTKYSCPTNSNFNPKLQLCDVDYECPCQTSEVTSTTEEVTTQDVTVTTTESINTEETKVSTEESTSTNGETTTEEDVSTKGDGTSESVTTTSTSTTATQTTTIDECSYNSNPNYFTCTVKGRFRNANDRTCQTYFLCSILSSGRVIQTKYSCPTNSNFNPKLQLCDVDYECPCQTSEVTSTTEEVTTQDVTVTTTESINTEETKVSTEESTSTNGETTTEEDVSTKGDGTSESVTTTSTSTTATQTTTIDECSYNSNPNYFTCTVKGRFRNANDRTCQTYFLCSILSSGRVIQTKYSCPTNSNFNPKLQLCDVDYECPCQTSEVTSTTEEVTTQDVTVTTTQSINTEETKVSTEESTSTNGETTTEEDVSTKGDGTSESVTTTSTSTTATQTTTIDECSYNSNPNYFTCTVKGRFRNANDRTCQTYFLCSILSSGRVIKTKYSCPTNSNFNPKLQLCDVDYECPCQTSEVTSTTEEVTTQDVTVTTTESINTEETKVSTEESTSTNGETTTEEDVTTKGDGTSESVTTTSTSTTATQTTTIDECSYNSNPNYFTCTAKGRFRNANDRTCQTYFLCSILSSGRVIKTKYSCPTNSNFNPKLQLCDVDYECPCQTSEVTSTTEEVTTQDVTVTTTESINTEETKVSTEESTSTNGETTTEEDVTTKGDGTSESVTTTSTSTTITQTTTNDECFYNSNPNYFTCTVKGRFRNTNDRTCQTYFLCSILSSGRVIQTKYSCPTNSNFNPKLQLCDVDYECPCQTSEVTSTTQEVTTQDVTVTTTEESTSTNGETTTQERTTEEDESTKGGDTTESVTTSTSTTITQTTTNDECSYNSNPNYFTCTVKGRFRNANDRTCQTYFLCSILSSGRVIQTKYSCPTNSNFNPKLQLCDVDYECPCQTSEVTSTTEEVTTQDVTVTTTESINTEETKVTTEESTSTNGETTTEEDVSTKGDGTSESVTTTSTSTTITQTTTINECSYNSNPNYFTCTVKGRFSNANDRTCQTYFLCSILSSGRVIQTKYSCPTNSNFNPELQLCDVDYECPCQISEVTATTEEVTA